MDLGSVNDHLLTFEASLDTDTNEYIALAECNDLHGERTFYFAAVLIHVHVFPLPLLLCYWRPALSAIWETVYTYMYHLEQMGHKVSQN